MLPPAECVGTQTLRIYKLPATCDGYDCVFPYEDVPCQLGCVDGACLTEGEDTPIQAIQNGDHPDHPAAGAIVRVKGVVVTSHADQHGFWVSEPEGGPWSGVFVYKGNLIFSVEVELGDIVDITGEVNEYHGNTQILAALVSLAGSGDLPPPTVVTPSQICTAGGDNLTCADGADAEMYEGVYLRVEGVSVANAGFGSGAFTVSAAGSSDEALIQDRFVSQDLFTAVDGFAFQSITGVLDYNYDYYRLAPTLCADLLDASGQAVCEEVVCPEGPVTIAQIRDRSREDAVPPGCSVLVEDVVMIGALDGANVFFQDPDAAAWGGIFVYSSQGLFDGLPLGTHGNLSGVYGEYGFSELHLSTNGFESLGEGALPAPVLVDAAEICTFRGDGQFCTTGEPYESMLVEVRDLVIVETPFLNLFGVDIGDFLAVSPQAPDSYLLVEGVFGHEYTCPPGAAGCAKTPGTL